MAGTRHWISFDATLRRPVEPGRAAWRFLQLPAAASKRLPSRGMVTVDGRLAGVPFRAGLAPDGQGGHWLKVDKALREAAEVDAGDLVHLEVAPVEREPEPRVPADLARALADDEAAASTWSDITAVARRDWILWISSGKKAQTRARRLEVAIDKLAKGQRRACCFDRTGMYGKGAMGPPAARPS